MPAIALSCSNANTGVGGPAESSSRPRPQSSSKCAADALCASRDTWILSRPSKPWGCRSKTLTPTAEPARYCAGDVSGERGPRVQSIYTAWERGDYSSAAWAHPEIETVMADGPTPGIWTGVAG